jgi:hypothetical protein
MDGSQEVGRQPVVAGGDATEIFEATEYALDGVAATTGERAETALPGLLRFGGMFGTAPCLWICWRTAWVSQARSAMTRLADGRFRNSTSAARQPAA